MAQKYKGIELEIGGNTSGLKKALNDVDKQLNTTQIELGKVDRLLKLDPKNTELLAQKQKLLAGQVENTKERLEALKSTKAKADEAMKNGTEVNEKQYRELQREIVQTEKNLKKLTKEANGFTKAGAELKKVGGKITEIGKKGLAITATVGAVAAASVKMASDYEESLNKVDVAFGENADEVKKWADTSLKNFGLAKGTALETASLYGDMGTAMGLTTGDASKMATSLTGLSADLASFKNVSQEVAQNALKGIFTGEGESLKSLGIIMQDTTLKEYALANGYKKKYEDMTQAEKVQLRYNYVMENTKNAQGDFARTSDGTANSIRTFQETVKELSAQIGEKLLPIITPIIQKITEWVQWFGTLDGSTQTIIMVIAGLAAVLPPILIIVGSMITAIGTITTALGLHSASLVAETAATTTATAAQTGLNLAFLACPITWIVLGITSLVAAFIVLWNKCEWFRNFWIGLWDNIKNVFSTVVDFIKENWKQLATFIINPIAGVIALLYKLNPKFKAWVDNLINSIIAWFGRMKDVGVNLIKGLWNGIKDTIGWLKDMVKGVVDKIKGWFTGKDGFDEHSPSKWAEKVGVFLMQGLAEGITNDMSAEQALEKKISNLKNFMSKELGITDTDIKLSDAEYELWSLQNPNADETAKNNKKIGLLMSKITAQSEAVQIANDALYESVQLTGENSQESKEYQLQLTNEKIELEKLNEEMREALTLRQQMYNAANNTSISDYNSSLKALNRNPIAYMRQNNTAFGTAQGQTVNNVTQNYYGYKGTISENNAALRKTLKNAEVSLA